MKKDEPKKKNKLILNLGCGKTRIPDSIGVDIVKIDGFVDVIHDLNKIPYPFKNGSISEIYFYHVLEHLSDPLGVMEEIFRLLKPQGILYMKVPHFSSMGAFTDFTHKRPFGFYSFDFFEKGNYQDFYSPARFEILKKKIKYLGLYPNNNFYQKYVHGNKCFFLFKPMVKIIDFFINVSPIFFERVWCYWIGGATEIDLIMRKA